MTLKLSDFSIFFQKGQNVTSLPSIPYLILPNHLYSPVVLFVNDRLRLRVRYPPHPRLLTLLSLRIAIVLNHLFIGRFCARKSSAWAQLHNTPSSPPPAASLCCGPHRVRTPLVAAVSRYGALYQLRLDVGRLLSASEQLEVLGSTGLLEASVGDAVAHGLWHHRDLPS